MSQLEEARPILQLDDAGIAMPAADNGAPRNGTGGAVAGLSRLVELGALMDDLPRRRSEPFWRQGFSCRGVVVAEHAEVPVTPTTAIHCTANLHVAIATSAANGCGDALA